MDTTPQAAQDPFDRRQKWLLVIAWGATVLPLAMFAWLTWASYDMQKKLDASTSELARKQKEVGQLEQRKADLDRELAKLGKDLDAQRESTKHYRDYADVKVRFYRESDREMIEGALSKLGFKVDSALGASKLIDRKPNTIAYGKLVSVQDLRDIAVALVKDGFPLKRIAPALKQPDPNLIQIYASAESDQECGLLTVEQVQAGGVCGTRR